jgi:WD40 repeat protein
MQVLKGFGYNEVVWGVAFTPDGRELVSVGGSHGEVVWWDLAAGTHRRGDRRYAYMPTLALSPDGQRLARSLYRDVAVEERDGKLMHLLHCSGGVGALRYSPDGQVLAAAAGNLMRWETANYTQLPANWLDQGEFSMALAYSCDGRTLAVTGGIRVVLRGVRTYPAGCHVRLLDAQTGARRAELKGPTGEITCVAFSSDGKFVAAAAGQSLWAWSTSTTEPVLQQRFNKQHFKELAFTPDCRHLLTVRNDETVRLWDTSNWTQAAAFDWDIGGLVSLAIAADGMRAAAGGKKGRIIVWDLDL